MTEESPINQSETPEPTNGEKPFVVQAQPPPIEERSLPIPATRPSRDPNLDAHALELCKRVILAVGSVPPGQPTASNLAAALTVAQNERDEVLATAILYMTQPAWRISGNWIVDLKREAKVIALCWLAQAYWLGTQHAKAP